MINKIRKQPQIEGYLCLVLHAHLPYIRHHDRSDYLEERWFYEAMTETYLPLIDVFDRLIDEQIEFKITMSMTPTLLAMCSDSLMKQRYLMHLNQLIRLSESECKRLVDHPQYLQIAVMYHERFKALKSIYLSNNQNIIEQFKQYQDAGYVEIITCASTHGYLPLMKTEEAIRSQIATAVKDYERHFNCRPKGIWLPECAFTPGVDRILKQYQIDYFIADSTAVQYASPHPNRELYAPLMTPYGISAFPRDPESAKQVWSSTDGYPGDYDYREYYRDIGWDLGWNDQEEWEYIRPYVLPTTDRINTGIKYYRITGKGKHREPYNPEWASAKAALHAEDFLRRRTEQAKQWNQSLDRTPLIVSPYDAELFGHWWYEGPQWIEQLCRKAFHDQHAITLTTPSSYLQQYPIADTGWVNESSWGRNHSAEVWLQQNNDWIYRRLHQTEERMIKLASQHAKLDAEINIELLQRALNQCARELQLAQSSDWAFIMDAKTVVEYAVQRTKDHLSQFHQLADMIEQKQIDETYLCNLEDKNNCFPLMDYKDYVAVPQDVQHTSLSLEEVIEATKQQRNIFMLAWEYPPKQVGGLSRAVCELSEALAAQGSTVHILTSSYFGAPYLECLNGVYVHRVPILTSGDTDFYHWTFEMNVAMVDYLVKWNELGGRIDLLHAHDWMVFHAAREIKHSFSIPLIATIHATEWGRNQGQLETPLQKNIHQLEWKLTYEAEEVFVCSEYMKQELNSIFQLPTDKISVIPNGIQIDTFDHNNMIAPTHHWMKPGDRMIFFIGRLVYEKGVQILIQAMPQILSKLPQAKLVIAGTGPMLEELQSMAFHLGDRVSFSGYIDEEMKEALYRQADVCVFPSLYEPFGIVALEAMKNRKAVVVSDTGGLAEIIDHGHSGYKALPGHVDSLYWHISEILLQPDLGQRMAETAYQKLVTQYSWISIAAQMQDCYRQLLSEKPTLTV